MPKLPTYSNKQFFKDYWMFLEGHRPKFLFYTAIKAITDLRPFATAYLLALLIDFLANYNNEPLTKLYLLIATIAILSVTQVLIRWYCKFKINTIGAKIRETVRVEAMSKLIDLELQWHEKEETGSKLTKINSGGQNIAKGLRFFSNQGISVPTAIIGGFILLTTISSTYAIIAFVYMLIYLIGEQRTSETLHKRDIEQSIINEKVSGKLHESTSNLLTVKSLGLKQTFTKSTSRLEKQFYRAWLKTQKAVEWKFKSLKTFASLGYAVFLTAIALDAVHGTISVGLFVAYSSYFNQFNNGLQGVTNNAWQYSSIKAKINRFMTIFGKEVFDRNSADHKEIPKDWKTIEFRNVYFSYKNKPVLENFNLKIERNKKIGIVGRTGCGKSTLVKLLLGLYKPQRGQILINNTPLETFKHTSITDTISIVLQESEMFNQSLINNVTIATQRKDLKQFKKAVKISQLEPVIKKLPKGLNTPIGEKGYKLSGGERQRVGLARVIYKNSSVMLLDEATSSLDSKTEHKIQEAIEKYLKDNTLIIIAHRLSTLKDVDKIIVMSRGKIVEQGTYMQLIGMKGKFYDLYKHQKNK